VARVVQGDKVVFHPTGGKQFSNTHSDWFKRVTRYKIRLSDWLGPEVTPCTTDQLGTLSNGNVEVIGKLEVGSAVFILATDGKTPVLISLT